MATRPDPSPKTKALLAALKKEARTLSETSEDRFMMVLKRWLAAPKAHVQKKRSP